MLEIDEFKKILKKENIEISKETDIDFLNEFTNILADKIFDDWLEIKK